MPFEFKASVALILVCAILGAAEPEPPKKPIELQALRDSVGVWDAEIEVWPQGLDKDSIKFQGVETNRLYGDYWISSDFDSDFNGQTLKVHSIVGYDLDQKQLVGKVIDDGPYAASMTGEYDAGSKTVTWRTDVKAADGTPIVQKTQVTQISADERRLVLMMPGAERKRLHQVHGNQVCASEVRFVRRLIHGELSRLTASRRRQRCGSAGKARVSVCRSWRVRSASAELVTTEPAKRRAYYLVAARCRVLSVGTRTSRRPCQRKTKL